MVVNSAALSLAEILLAKRAERVRVNWCRLRAVPILYPLLSHNRAGATTQRSKKTVRTANKRQPFRPEHHGRIASISGFSEFVDASGRRSIGMPVRQLTR